MSKKERLTFTGHDTFYCRSYWLKKGYDFVKKGGKFNDNAVIELGVGRNMVNAIRYWLRCFGLTNEQDELTDIAILIFDDDKGLDPYCEDKGTVWLLHYLLVTTRKASIYSIVFNDFRKEFVDFNKEQLFDYLRNFCKREDFTVHDSSLERDIDVFINNYLIPNRTKSIEDTFLGILQELKLVERAGRYEGKDLYKIEGKERKNLPALIVLFAIIRQLKDNTSVTFFELQTNIDSVGGIFALNAHGLMQKIEELLDLFPQHLVFTDDGGIRLLQLKKQFLEIDILKQFYASQSVAFG